MGKKNSQSMFDLSVKNESLDELVEPRYIIRNFYSSPLVKTWFTEEDLYAREEREYRRMLRKAHKKHASVIPAYSFSDEYISPAPVIIRSSNNAAAAGELLEKVRPQYEPVINPEKRTEEVIIPEHDRPTDECESREDSSRETEFKIPTQFEESVLDQVPQVDEKTCGFIHPEPPQHKTDECRTPAPQPAFPDDEEVIRIPEDPFFPETKKDVDSSLKTRMSIKYDTEKDQRPSRIKRQKREGDQSEKGSKLPSKRRFREKAPGEKELEMKRIAELINQDGYYDDRVPADAGISHKTVRKGYYIKLGLLVGLTLAVLIGFICYLIFWF